MAEDLIAIGVGSPHDFISSGRRARDIWFGSHLLANLTLAVALRLRRMGAEVIVPYLPPEADDEDALVLDLDQPARNGNMILASLRSERRAEASREVHEALQQCWSALVAQTWRVVAPIVEQEDWEAQTKHCPIDLYFSPVQVETRLDEKNSYAKERRRAMQALASHKLQRRFAPNPAPRPVPKSSLDGVSESVLRRRGQGAGSREETLLLRQDILARNMDLHFILRLGLAEELDAVGLMKRAAVSRRLPSLSGVAVDPWVRGVAAGECGLLLEQLGRLAYARAGSYAAGLNAQQIQDKFRHDGSLLLEDGLRVQKRDIERALKNTRRLGGAAAEIGKAALEAEKTRLEQMEPLLRKLHAEAGAPSPYYVIISADGDEVGRQIDQRAGTPKAHRAMSQALTGYAAAAVELIESERGTVIYAGGEDLLALLPLDTALRAIGALTRCYADAWQAIAPPKSATRPAARGPQAAAAGDEPQTLSIGIAIAHCRDAFDAALQAAREGEQAAKQRRRREQEKAPHLVRGVSYCAIHWMPRTGTDFTLTGPQTVLQRLDAFAQLHLDDAMADAIGYQLLRLNAIYEGWEPVSHQYADRQRALQLELQHLLLRRKRSEEAAARITAALQQLLLECDGDSSTLLQRLGQELVLARRIAQCRRQAPQAATTEEPQHGQ